MLPSVRGAASATEFVFATTLGPMAGGGQAGGGVWRRGNGFVRGLLGVRGPRLLRVDRSRLGEEPQHVVPLLRCVPRVVRLRRLVQSVDPAHKEVGIFPRAYALSPDPHVDR